MGYSETPYLKGTTMTAKELATDTVATFIGSFVVVFAINMWTTRHIRREGRELVKEQTLSNIAAYTAK